MKINSYTSKEELAEFSGLSLDEAKYLKNILIDECHQDTGNIGVDDWAQILETARRFSEENKV